MLLGCKVGNALEGFILKFHDYLLNYDFVCLGFVYGCSKEQHLEEMVRVYHSGLKIWARTHSFVETARFTQPEALSISLM
jgi:hypothetical protein